MGGRRRQRHRGRCRGRRRRSGRRLGRGGFGAGLRGRGRPLDGRHDDPGGGEAGRLPPAGLPGILVRGGHVRPPRAPVREQVPRARAEGRGQLPARRDRRARLGRRRGPAGGLRGCGLQANLQESQRLVRRAVHPRGPAKEWRRPRVRGARRCGVQQRRGGGRGHARGEAAPRVTAAAAGSETPPALGLTASARPRVRL